MRKEVEAMQLLKSKRLMLLLISLASIFALGVTTSIAQEKIKISGKRYGVFTKMEMMNVDDTEGHTLSLVESKGVDVVTGDWFVSKMLADGVMGGTGTVRGYGKIIDKDGDVRFETVETKTTFILSPEGKPIGATMEGTFSFTKGTGKWENIHGGGTAKGKFIAPEIYMVDWEGEYFIKK
jgi:hypothetical protein